MKKLALLAALAIGSSLTTGCVTRRIVTFEDHEKLPVTSMQVIKHTNYLIFQTFEHQFYLCQDGGNSLTCNLQCGGAKNDLKCPSVFTNGNGTSAASNVR
jgi:hypothetical protein